MWLGGIGTGTGMTNVTISGNSASDFYGGQTGGIFVESGSLFVANSTIANNVGGGGRGIGNILGDQTIINSILTGHEGSDCWNGSATFVSGGNNIEGGTSCEFTQPTDLQNTNPLIGPLQDNGGLTETHALLPGSPAINAANDTVCAVSPVNGVDQRGVNRPQGTHCDIGAYEFEGNAPPALLLNLFRSPASITKGSAASGPNQWFARVALGDHTGDPGLAFHYVVWLHVPEDWTLPWATQYSFTGDFANGTLSPDWTAQPWVQDTTNCALGGAADAGFKWRAFRGPLEALPPLVDRLNNQVNLRGGLGVPGGETSDLYGGVRVVLGTYYDFDTDGTPERYQCDNVGVTSITVTD